MSGSNGNNYFDLVFLKETFSNSLVSENDIDLELYLKSYQELEKFCSILGSVFGFVATEIKSKSEIMLELIQTKPESYKTIRSMISYEKGNNLLDDPKFVNGCRTLLRLHRGLAFIKGFIDKIHPLERDAQTGPVCREVYKETLACHHVWYVKAGAWMAMSILPNKETLVRQLVGDYSDDMMRLLPETVEVLDKVYSLTQSCYEEFSLLDLA